MDKEPQDLADEAEAEAKALERQADQLDEHIQSARSEWEAKKADPKVPTAQPEAEGEEQAEQQSEEGQP